MATRRPAARGAQRPASHKPQTSRNDAARGRRRPEHRRPWWQSPAVLGGGAAGAAVIAVIAIVVVSVAGGQQSSGTTGGAAVQASVLDAVTKPSTTTLAQVGSGGQPGHLATLPGPTLTDAEGKPVVVYAGGEYCPFCAAERWAIVAALSRFGTFSGLQETTSSATDVYPNTSTFTFLHASYSSPYVDFQSAELLDRNQQPLQSPSPTVANAFNTYDQPPYTTTAQSLPFLDIAGRYVLSSTSYSPQLLQGLSWSQIAAQMSNPSSPVAQAILGNANILTAAICSANGNQPQPVCSAPYIQAIEATLPH